MGGTIELIEKYLAKKLVRVEETKDPVIIESRLRRCRSCDRLKDEQCELCGCYVEIKATSLVNRNKRGQLEPTHCPLGKWGDRELALRISKHKNLIR